MAKIINNINQARILFLILSVILTSCSIEKQTALHEPESFHDGAEVYYFYFYRKYVNNIGKEDILVCATYKKPNNVSLFPTDHGNRSYQYPRFMTSHDYTLEDSGVAFKTFKYKEEIVNFSREVGDTLYSQMSPGWIFESSSEYLGLPMYEMRYIGDGGNNRIRYVHNLGFILDERIYPDSVVSWKLEAINGIPVEIFIKKNPLYQYFE